MTGNVSGTHDLYVTFEFNYSDVNFSAEEVEKIKNADAVIVVAGTRTIDGGGAPGNPDSDSAEEVDRETLDLPRNQAGSILKCTELNKNTAVCIQEVVQMYVTAPDAQAKDRAVKSLKGFDKVALKAGETKTVIMTLETKGVEYWDDVNNKFDYDLGTYTISVGSDSEQVKGTKTFTMTEKVEPALKTVTLTGKAVFDETEIGTPVQSTLTAAMSDESFTDITDVTYTSSDENVATVDKNGVVMPIAAGTAVIRAAVTKNGVTEEGSYAVAVQEGVKDLYYITSKNDNKVIAVNGGSTQEMKTIIW